MKMKIILGRTGSRTIPITTPTGVGVGDRLSSSLFDRYSRHFGDSGTLQPQPQPQPPIAPPQYLQQQKQLQLRQVEEGAIFNSVNLRSSSLAASASVVSPLTMMLKKNSRSHTNLFRRYYSTSKIHLEKEKEEKKEDKTATITTATTSSSSDTTMNATTMTTKKEGDVYDPWEIVTTFQDTSYYTPPDEELAPEYLAAKYAHLSNADLLEVTTIGRTTTETHAPTMDTTTETATTETNLWQQYMHSPPVRDTNQSFRKGTLYGVVCSTKMDKTINVEVDRYKVHKKYHKRLKYTKKFMAHDEHEVAMLGDTVLISPCQRLSKKKHFMLQSIVTAKGQL